MTENVGLSPVPRATVSGVVTDGSGHSWPLYARITVDGVPGGPVFTDPATVTGLLRRDELILRSRAMGEFVFTPPGLDERLLREVGFTDVRVEDVTENAVQVGSAWHAARERHSAELDLIEGAAENAATQRFLWTVAALARERRLSRIAYVALRL